MTRKVYKLKFVDGLQVGFEPGIIARHDYDPATDMFAFYREDGSIYMQAPKRNVTVLVVEDQPTPGIGSESNIDAKFIEEQVAKANIPEDVRTKIIDAARSEAARYVLRKDANQLAIFDTTAPAGLWYVKAEGYEPTLKELIRLANKAHSTETATAEQRKREAEADIVMAVIIKDEKPIGSISRALFDEWMKAGTFRSVLSPIVENPQSGDQYNFAFTDDGQVLLRRCVLSVNSDRRHEISQTISSTRLAT